MKTLEYKALAGPIVTVKIADPASTTNGGKTALTSASSGLIIAIRPDNSAATTAYTASGTTIDTITTLGVYAAPTAGHCRFKEIDATNHPGHYELQFAAGLWATAGARKLVGTVLVTGGAQTDFEIQLSGPDVGAVAGGTGALIQFGASAGQINPASGKVPATIASGDDVDGAIVRTNVGLYAGTGYSGNVTAVTSGASFTVTLAGSPALTAANLVGLTCQFVSGANSPVALDITGASGSAGVYALTFTSPSVFPNAPSTGGGGDSVVIYPGR